MDDPPFRMYSIKMKTRPKYYCIGFSCIIFALLSAGKINHSYPSYFPEPFYSFQKNPLKKEQVLLGRALFYDPILSLNDSVSCASCHNPFSAFAHTDHALSHGIYDQIGKRNAPALFNLAWNKLLMWDGAVNHIDVQALAPISNPIEMKEDLKHIVEKLKKSSRYPSLFTTAFGDDTITGERILKSLSQFQRSLISCNSKYDSVMNHQSRFTDQEDRGYTLFLQHCRSCHTEPLFSNYEFANNGLPPDPTLNDAGRVGITHVSKDSFSFKIPSLRNIGYTYPYMHDGRFKKLNDVLLFYSESARRSGKEDERVKRIPALSSEQRIDLIAFLLTLNDKDFVFRKENQFPKEILLRGKE